MSCGRGQPVAMSSGVEMSCSGGQPVERARAREREREAKFTTGGEREGRKREREMGIQRREEYGPWR